MTDRKVVDHLSLRGLKVEIAVHLVVIEGANAGGCQPERFGSDIKAVADCPGFEMHVAVAPITMGLGGAINIRNHGKRHTGIAGQVLSEAESGGCDSLIPGPDLLQLSSARPVSIHSTL